MDQADVRRVVANAHKSAIMQVMTSHGCSGGGTPSINQKSAWMYCKECGKCYRLNLATDSVRTPESVSGSSYRCTGKEKIGSAGMRTLSVRA